MSSQNILITGGSGLIGRRLREILEAEGYGTTILTRGPSRPDEGAYHWDPLKGELDTAALQDAKAIIHLAGASIGDRRWSASRKKVILESRTSSTRLLAEELAKMSHPPRVVVSASAIGFYGDRGDELVDENSKPGEGFLADVTRAWEEESAKLDEIVERSVRLRFGVVLSRRGGALEQMKRPVEFFVGSPLGSGNQYVSWIHIDDLCRIVVQALSDPSMKGVYNAVAPEPVTNREMTQAIASALGRPILLPLVPGFVLKIVLGQMSDLVLQSQRVSSERIEKAGYRFHFTSINEALADLLGLSNTG